MSEIIVGWDNIAKFTPYTANTFKIKHAPAMLRAGFAFRGHPDIPGRYKKVPTIWTFKELIYSYLSATQVKKGRV